MDTFLLFSRLLVPAHSSLAIQDIQVDETLTVRLHSTESAGTCSGCGRTSTRLHSRYTRTLSDLPMSGRRVRLLVQVRRFFCPNPACPLKTFAERFPELADPHAQRTLRLQQALEHLGLALGGEAGARQGQQFGLPASPDSLLRLVRQRAASSSPRATHIGIDDWAYKRRLRYGTVICDLDSGDVVDLLPDRSVQTVYTWLRQHPEVEVISRDRWSEYATAAQKGAPQALQVADRWHLLNNLVEQLTHLLARLRSQVREQTTTIVQDTSPAVSAPVAQRQDRYHHIQTLHQRGLAPASIARRVGLSERTVYRWLARQAAPHGRHRARSVSVIDPYKSYVKRRWQEGCRKGSQLCQELKAQGYRGSERAVYRYLSFLHDMSAPAEQASTAIAASSEAFSAKAAVWWLIRWPAELDAEQQQALQSLCQVSPEIEKAYHLAQSFRSMLRLRQGAERLDAWLQEASQSGLPELLQFAAGIQRDKAAVQAGLSLPYSNGLVEGHITRLKLIKRSMYGRANFDLLRQRVLRAS